MVNLETDELVDLTGKKYNLKAEKKKAHINMKLLVKSSRFNLDIKDTLQILESFPEWEKRYVAYAEEISAIDFIKLVRSKFRECTPLKLYINVTNAKNSVWFVL